MSSWTRRAVLGRGLVATGVTAGALGVACAPGGSEAPGGDASGPPVKITFLNTSAAVAAVHQLQFDEFNRRNARIVVEQVVASDGPFFEKLQAQVAAGTPP